MIRCCTAVPDQKADPLPWDRHTRGWRAEIQIGYAVQGEEGRLQFKLKEELSREETADA
jgi:hypothetical protein